MNILKHKKIYFIVSLAVILAGIIAYIAFGGLNFGLDFMGGTEIRMNIGKEFDNADISKIVEETTGVKPSVQKAGTTEVSIKTEEIDTEKRDAIVEAIKEKYALDETALQEATNVSASASTKLLMMSTPSVMAGCSFSSSSAGKRPSTWSICEPTG